MPTKVEMEGKIGEILGRIMPAAVVERIEARAMVDSVGENSLSIKVIVRERPPEQEVARLFEVVDEFRTWLASRDDERFPYFRLLSRAEEREIQEVDR